MFKRIDASFEMITYSVCKAKSSASLSVAMSKLNRSLINQMDNGKHYQLSNVLIRIVQVCSIMHIASKAAQL